MPCYTPSPSVVEPFPDLVAEPFPDLVADDLAENSVVQSTREIRTSSWRYQMLDSLMDAAGHCFDTGEYKEAENLHERLLELRQELLGKFSPEYADDLSKLAVVRMAQGRLESALPALEEAQAIMRMSKGERHADYAMILNNLAALYKARGFFEDAEPLYVKAVCIRRTELGDSHPAYASSLSSLALLYEAMDRLDEAVPLHLEASDIRSVALGESHPGFVASIENLARLHAARGENRKALDLYEEAAAIHKDVLGASHPTYASSLNNLAMQYMTLGEPERAEPLLAEARSIFAKQPKPPAGHFPAGASHVGNIAELYRSMPAFDKKIPALKSTLHRCRDLTLHSAIIQEESDARFDIDDKPSARGCYCSLMVV